MIGATRLRNLAPLLVGVVLLVVLVVLAKRWDVGLTRWATEELGTLWGTCALVFYGTAAFMAVRSFPLLRDARLYAFTLLLLPLAAVQFLHTTRAWENMGAPRLGPLVDQLDTWLVLLVPVVVLLACAERPPRSSSPRMRAASGLWKRICPLWSTTTIPWPTFVSTSS